MTADSALWSASAAVPGSVPDGRAGPDEPAFALTFDAEAVHLMEREGEGWSWRGAARFDADDLPGRMAALRRLLPPDADGQVALIIPDDQILYTSVAVEPALPRGEAVLRAMDGLTPYDVDDLALDWRDEETDRVKVAAVWRQTLAEAEGFAARNGFVPALLLADTGAHELSGGVRFDSGPTRVHGRRGARAGARRLVAELARNRPEVAPAAGGPVSTEAAGETETPGFAEASAAFAIADEGVFSRVETAGDVEEIPTPDAEAEGPAAPLPDAATGQPDTDAEAATVDTAHDADAGMESPESAVPEANADTAPNAEDLAASIARIRALSRRGSAAATASLAPEGPEAQGALAERVLDAERGRARARGETLRRQSELLPIAPDDASEPTADVAGAEGQNSAPITDGLPRPAALEVPEPSAVEGGGEAVGDGLTSPLPTPLAAEAGEPVSPPPAAPAAGRKLGAQTAKPAGPVRAAAAPPPARLSPHPPAGGRFDGYGGLGVMLGLLAVGLLAVFVFVGGDAEAPEPSVAVAEATTPAPASAAETSDEPAAAPAPSTAPPSAGPVAAEPDPAPAAAAPTPPTASAAAEAPTAVPVPADPVAAASEGVSAPPVPAAAAPAPPVASAVETSPPPASAPAAVAVPGSQTPATPAADPATSPPDEPAAAEAPAPAAAAAPTPQPAAPVAEAAPALAAPTAPETSAAPVPRSSAIQDALAQAVAEAEAPAADAGDSPAAAAETPAAAPPPVAPAAQPAAPVTSVRPAPRPSRPVAPAAAALPAAAEAPVATGPRPAARSGAAANPADDARAAAPAPRPSAPAPEAAPVPATAPRPVPRPRDLSQQGAFWHARPQGHRDLPPLPRLALAGHAAPLPAELRLFAGLHPDTARGALRVHGPSEAALLRLAAAPRFAQARPPRRGGAADAPAGRPDAVEAAVDAAIGEAAPAAPAATQARMSARPVRRPAAGTASTPATGLLSAEAVEDAIAAAIEASPAPPGGVALTALRSSPLPPRAPPRVATAPAAAADPAPAAAPAPPDAAQAERRRLDDELQAAVEARIRARAAADAKVEAEQRAAAEARARAQAAAEERAAAARRQPVRPVEIDEEPELAAAPAAGATAASVAANATHARGMDLNRTTLIGVIGAGPASRGLIRLRNGRVVTVRLGDRIDGGTITAIGDGRVAYVRSGRPHELRILDGR